MISDTIIERDDDSSVKSNPNNHNSDMSSSIDAI